MAHPRRSKTIDAAPAAVWKLVEDPHHMPRWWPGVTRMEGVGDEQFTQVYTSSRGRTVRMDFQVVASEPPWRRMWSQELAGTPFERVLGESVIEIALEPDGTGTKVTIEQRQKLKGYSKTGAFMVRRATGRRLAEALDGLAQIAV
ncbi:MAG: SRPBCC family protein [Solirubrobacteraceae bacterium]